MKIKENPLVKLRVEWFSTSFSSSWNLTFGFEMLNAEGWRNMDNTFCALQLAVVLTMEAVYSHRNLFAFGPELTFFASVRAADVLV